MGPALCLPVRLDRGGHHSYTGDYVRSMQWITLVSTLVGAAIATG
ncbi:hypothetical protein WB401_41040 [Streptomyces brasiliscabiei]|uniref:Uncharacterized protein n=1 Tax=Streptomyces brasiliscabiei TaxID=2736302 RepID=A0ABU8GF47_9ACTN